MTRGQVVLGRSQTVARTWGHTSHTGSGEEPPFGEDVDRSPSPTTGVDGVDGRPKRPGGPVRHTCVDDVGDGVVEGPPLPEDRVPGVRRPRRRDVLQVVGPVV